MQFSRWKIRAIVDFKHPRKTYINTAGAGELTTWDLVDETGSINLVAFNLQSNILASRMILGKVINLEKM